MTHLGRRRILERYPERESVALELGPGELLFVKKITRVAWEYVQKLFDILDEFEDDDSFLLRARTHVVVLVLQLSSNMLEAGLLCAAYFHPNWLPEDVHQARRETSRDPRTLLLSTPELRGPTSITV